jgi:hypothetical protein
MHKRGGSGTAADLCLAQEVEIESGLLRGFFPGKGIFSDVSDRTLLDCTWIGRKSDLKRR